MIAVLHIGRHLLMPWPTFLTHIRGVTTLELRDEVGAGLLLDVLILESGPDLLLSPSSERPHEGASGTARSVREERIHQPTASCSFIRIIISVDLVRLKSIYSLIYKITAGCLECIFVRTQQMRFLIIMRSGRILLVFN